MMRKLFVFLFVFIASITSPAWADTLVTFYAGVDYAGGAYKDHFYPTADAAIKSQLQAGNDWDLAVHGGKAAYTFQLTQSSGTYFQFKRTCISDNPSYCSKGDFAYIDNNLRTEQRCPDGSVADYSNPWVPKCPVKADPCKDKSKMNRKFYYVNPPFVAPTHYGECLVDADQMLDCRVDAVGKYCWWQFHKNGNPYMGDAQADPKDGSTVGDDSPENPKDPTTQSPPFANKSASPQVCASCIPCPAGSVQAGIDDKGVPLCVGSGTNPPQTTTPTTTTSPDVTTKNDDGSTTTIGTKTQQNADGSTTTTTTTTVVKADGTKTVSQGSSTSQTSSGAVGKQDNPAADQSNLCKQNPDLQICRNSSVSGTCGAIVCNGDAIQCATLRAASAMQCAQQADSDELKAAAHTALGKTMLSGADPMQADIDKNKAGTEVDVSTPGTSMDDAGFVGGGACLPDKTFTFMGKAVTVEFGALCERLGTFRAVVLALAVLSWGFIVMGGIVSTSESSSI